MKRIIYTYVPQGGKGRNMGFRDEATFLKFFNESIAESRKSVKDVAVFCSLEDVDYLKERITGATIIGVDYSIYEFDKRFWNYYKVISLHLSAQAGAPALHLDLDAKLTAKLSKKLLQSDVLCEQRRAFYLPARQVSNRVPERVRSLIDPYIICSGIYGASDVAVVEAFYKIATEVVQVDFNNNEPVSEETLITMEESLFTLVCNQYKKKIETMPEGAYVHLQGNKKMMV